MADVSEVEKIVDTVVKKTARKIAGLLYLLWASFTPAGFLGSPLLMYISPKASQAFILLLIAVYMAATLRLMRGAYKMWSEKLSRSALVGFAIVFVLIAAAFTLAGAHWRLAMLAAAAFIVYGVYTFLRTSGAGVYWYDHAALLLLPPIFATAPEYPPLWGALSLMWMYAGAKSLVEVIER